MVGTGFAVQLAGIILSVGASMFPFILPSSLDPRASLMVSYGHGLFGYFEGGFRTAIEWAVITEVGTVILLSAGLAATASLTQARGDATRSWR